jgi:hypothetical protein
MERTDILVDENFNPICENGDFTTGNSDAQNVQILLSVNKAEFREFPTAGAGLVHFLKKPYNSLRPMRRECKVQLETDGYKMSSFSIDEEGNFEVDYEPNY